MKSQRIESLLVASALIVTGCVGSEGEIAGDEVDQIDKYIVWEGTEGALVARVRDRGFTPGIRVCLSGSGIDDTNRATREDMIRDAISTWIDTMRPVSDETLIGSGQITFECTAPDVNVNWSASTGRAWASAGNRSSGAAQVNLYSGNGASVVLHEFGHVFGLGDTYVEGVWTCQPGQPSSLMCSGTTLTADDIDGMKENFCAVFPGICLRRTHLQPSLYCPEESATFGDVDGDGHSDRICHVQSGDQGIIFVLAWNQASRTFSNSALFYSSWCGGTSKQLHVGDFNGDGRADLLCHDTVSGAKSVSLTGPGGTFGGTTSSTTVNKCRSTYDGELHIGDFNGDGRSDMLCHDTVSGEKWISFATASGTFTTTNWYSSTSMLCRSTYSGELHTGDFNGDGRDDLLCHQFVTGEKWVRLADSSGTFTGSNWYSDTTMKCRVSDLREIHVGDFDGDGRSDMLCHQTDTGKKWMAMATSTGTFPGITRNLPMNWCGDDHAGDVHVVELDGDGRADLFCNPAPGSSEYGRYAFQAP